MDGVPTGPGAPGRLSQRAAALLESAGRDSNADLHYSFLLSCVLADASASADYALAGGGSQDLSFS
jgi:hypothetical protein